MSNENERPVSVIRDGNLSASIWRRENGKETYYATTYSKNYKDEKGEYQTSHSFYGTDHLKLAELSKHVYRRERELYDKDRQAEKDDRSRNKHYDRER